MQDCFREHPEMYGSELQDDEDELEEEVRGEMAARDGEPSSQDADAPSSPRKDTSGLLSSQPQRTPKKEASTNTPTTSIPETKNNGDEGGALIPKDLHDGSSSPSKDS
jgi:intermembrane space import and assembly protein 40